ncbi:MAG: methyltransferase, partial [Egibacteraceae bacterium]
LSRSKHGRTVELAGHPPPPGDPPVPNSFVAALAGRHLRFCADWGVFSAQHIDAGTLLLFSVAAEGDRVPRVVDVGTGYGPLAVGLTVAGLAAQAVVTEVDAVALALALRNARAAGVSMRGVLEDDPAVAPKSDLTVCNFPTHLQRDRSDRLLRGLCQRAVSGRVLVVVHASLESRFVKRFAEERVCAEVERRSVHSVLALMPYGMRHPSTLREVRKV